MQDKAAEIAAQRERDAIVAWLRAGAKFVMAGTVSASERQIGVRDAYKFAADEIQAGQHYPFMSRAALEGSTK